jgi:uncharacterized protein (TIGR03032 family)
MAKNVTKAKNTGSTDSKSGRKSGARTRKTTPEPKARKNAGNKQNSKSKEQTVTYSVSPGLPGFLGNARITVAFSSYQSGKFYLVGNNPNGGIMIHERFFKKAMGIHVVNRDTLLLATLFQIHRFENTLAKGELINKTYDACYVPRVSHLTGSLDVHDVGMLTDGQIIFVNTRFNCLSVLSERQSFKPYWKPNFISKIINEDRCHLNGLAMENGTPRYVTAVSKSNTIDGWRDRRHNGGIVIDVQSGKIVLEGLSMPHSPRMYNGKLWVLNSGTGELGWVEIGKTPKTSKFHPLCFCPGFARGLSFAGKYAIVGLSRPRYERFEGLELDNKLAESDSEPWSGFQVIDLENGACVHWFRIDGAVAELYDVGVIPGVRCSMSHGFVSNEIISMITHEPFDEETASAKT